MKVKLRNLAQSRMQCLPLFFVAWLFWGGQYSLSQNRIINDDQAPAWRFQLAAPGAPIEDKRTPAEIKIEDNFFDSNYGASDPIDGPQRMGTGRSGPASFDEDFPARVRDEVIVAHFTTWFAYLSSSHRSIYTVLNLQIDRIVADKGGHMTERSVIPFVIPGGRVVSFAGQQLTYGIRGVDFPLEPNKEYLIFLFQPSPSFYMYLKAWNVDKGVLEPTTAFDSYRISQGRSSHAGKYLESAISELTAH